MEQELKENICHGGKMQGYEFTLIYHAAAIHIGGPYGGEYFKSAVKNEIGQVIWNWHDKKSES